MKKKKKAAEAAHINRNDANIQNSKDLYKVLEYFRYTVGTTLDFAISTGILRNCVTWYVRDLEAMNLLQSIFVGRDNTTGFLAKHYSADKTQWKSRKQEIQLSLFGEGSL